MNESAGLLSVVIAIVSVAVSLGVTGLVVWKVVIPLVKRSAEKQRVLSTGIPAQVTVTEMQNTGTLVNGNPLLNLTLNVQIEGRPVYQVTVQEIVPMMALGLLQPGRPLAARVDPNNLQSVAIDWSGRSAPMRAEQGGVARLLATGLSGQAQIVSFEPLPVPAVEGDAVMKFTVQVQVPDGRPQFGATVAQRVPQAVVGKFAPGTVVPCKVNPQNPSDMVLDFWGWAGIAPPPPAQGSAPALAAPMSPTPFGATPSTSPAFTNIANPAAPPGGGWRPQQ
jgi:hypothetical protein